MTDLRADPTCNSSLCMQTQRHLLRRQLDSSLHARSLQPARPPRRALALFVPKLQLRPSSPQQLTRSRLPSRRSITMAQALSQTPAVDEITSTLKKFGLNDLPKAPNTHPELNPFDIYRSHISELLVQASGVDQKIIYPTIQWTQSLDKGDLTLAVPALRIKGRKPDELAKEIAEKVYIRRSTGHAAIICSSRPAVPRIPSCRPAHRCRPLPAIFLQACAPYQSRHPLHP